MAPGPQVRRGTGRIRTMSAERSTSGVPVSSGLPDLIRRSRALRSGLFPDTGLGVGFSLLGHGWLDRRSSPRLTSFPSWFPGRPPDIPIRIMQHFAKRRAAFSKGNAFVLLHWNDAMPRLIASPPSRGFSTLGLNCSKRLRTSPTD